jgi:hypothetical protein
MGRVCVIITIFIIFYLGELSVIALGYGLDDRVSTAGLELLLFITASRPELGPTQPPNH